MPTGCVYELYSNEGEKTYIGSTIESLRMRLKGHLDKKKEFDDGKRTQGCGAFELIDMYNDIKIRLLEEVEYIDEDDTLLQQEEQKWIDMSKTCLNRIRAFTPYEWRLDENRERSFVWSEQNKEYKKQQDKLSYEKRKKETICSCGKKMLEHNIKKHLNSFKHQKWLSLQNN
jgi:hypothetical protein